MASTFLVAGDPAYWNYAQRFAAAATASPAASANYPLASIANGRADSPFQWGSYAASSRADFDLQALTNGTFDTDLTGWTDTDGAGASTRTTVGAEVFAGAGALKLDATAGVASRTQDVVVRAGEAWQITFYGLGDGVAGRARLRVFNMSTGNWLASGGGSWAAAVADAVTGTTAATYAQATVAFTVEGYQGCRYADTVILRVELLATSGIGYADSVEMYPGVNLLSVHGHTIPALYTLMMRSSTDAFSGSDTLQESTTTTTRPAVYLHESSGMVYRRYWRLRVNWGGTAPAGTYAPTPAMIGEAVLAQVAAATVTPRHPALAAHGRAEAFSQIRHETQAGVVWVHNTGTQVRRGWTLPWQTVSESEDRELIVDFWRRSAGGRHACLVVPDSSEDVVLYARLTGDAASERSFGTMGAPGFRTSLSVMEEAHPAEGA